MAIRHQRLVVLTAFLCVLFSIPAFAKSIDERLSSAAVSDSTINARVETVHAYIEALNNADLEIIRSLFAENAKVEDPKGSSPTNGREAIVEFYKNGPFLHPIKASLDGEVKVAGDSAAFSFTAYSNDLKMQIIDVFRFDSEGKIVEMTAYWSKQNISKANASN